MNEITTKRGLYKCEDSSHGTHTVAFYPADRSPRKKMLQSRHYHDLVLTTYGNRKNAVEAQYFNSRGDDIIVVDFGDDE